LIDFVHLTIVRPSLHLATEPSGRTSATYPWQLADGHILCLHSASTFFSCFQLIFVTTLACS